METLNSSQPERAAWPSSPGAARRRLGGTASRARDRMRLAAARARSAAAAARQLVVEADGRATHLTPTAFERDRARDARLAVAGYRVLRFTWRQIVAEPEAVGATLRALIVPG